MRQLNVDASYHNSSLDEAHIQLAAGMHYCQFAEQQVQFLRVELLHRPAVQARVLIHLLLYTVQAPVLAEL